MERGAPHSLPLMESGKLLPGVNLVIADPETKGQCGDSNLGEVEYLIQPTQLINIELIFLNAFFYCQHAYSS